MCLVACGGGSGTPAASATKGGAAPDHVTIGVFDTSLEFSAALAAGAPKGALNQVAKDFHTSFSYTYIANGNNLISALSGGSVQFAVVPASQVILAADQGLTLVPLMNGYVGPSVMAVAQAKYRSAKGTDVAKFDGLRWSYGRDGSTSQLCARTLVEQSGLNWTKQQRIPYGTSTDPQTLLATDRVDMLVAGGLPIAKALDQGIGYLVDNLQSDPKFPYAQNLFWELTVLPSLLQQYPQLVQAVTDANLTSLRALQSASSPAVALKLLPDNAQKDNGTYWNTLWKLESTGFVRANGTFTQAGINESLSLLQSSVTLKHASDDIKVFDNKYVVQAYKDLGLKGAQST